MSPDQAQLITGEIGLLSGYGIVRSGAAISGALTTGAYYSNNAVGGSGGSYNIALNTSLINRTGTFNESRNRLKKVWKRES